MNRILFIFLLLLATNVQGEELSLNSFLESVRAQSLDLKLEVAKFEAADARALGVNIPAPMLGMSRLKEELKPVAKGFEISQSIPFPTKIVGDTSARKYEAKSQEQAQIARESEILAQAKLLYFTLWANQEKLNLLQEKKNILENHIRLSRSAARSDSFAGIHLIKAESDLDFLDNDILSTEQNLRAKQVEAASLVNRDPSTFKPILTEAPASKIPTIESVDSIPQIRSMEFSLESLKSRELEAKSQWLPDFNFRYKEMGATSMAARYNEVFVGVTLPFVFFWEPYAASRQAIAQRAQSEYELEKQKRNLESEKISLSTKAESIKKQLDTLREKIIPRAEKRMKLVHNLAPRDMETLQDHREATEAFPELKMKALELRLEYEAAVAAMEKYLSNKGQFYDSHNE